MKALITGISGFTGKHLAELLKKEKVRVTGIDVHKGEYYQADLTDKKRVTEIFGDKKTEREQTNLKSKNGHSKGSVFARGTQEKSS